MKQGKHSRLRELILLSVILAGIFLFPGCGDRKKQSDVTGLFTEITFDRKLDFVHDPAVDSSYYMPESIGSGGAFLDYDNDGDLDIYLLNGAERGRKKSDKPLLRNQLFRQEADGTFQDVTEISGLGDTGYGMGVAVGDIDNDGYVDVYISNDGPDALYRNNGDGTFSDITPTSGIHNPDWGISVIFVDFDLDGFLDVFVTNYVKFDTSTICTDRVGRRDYCGPQGFPGYSDRLFRNNGDLTFTDVSALAGFSKEKSAGLGVTSADFNHDFYPDIYVGNDREPNHLWINQGDGTFINQALILGCSINELGVAEASMGITVGDIDNDNDLDLFMGHFRGEKNTLYRNLGEIGFQDESAVSGLAAVSLPFTGFGTGFFDFDHDGDLDLAVVNGRVIRGPLYTKSRPAQYWDYYAEPNLLFENDGTGHFHDISNLATAFTGMVENSRALVFGDVDNDGDIDLLVTNEGGRARLYRNDAEKKGHWLLVQAIDPTLNRDAYGARLVLPVNGEKLLRLVNPGYSFCASHDPRVHFGVRTTAGIENLVVEWPGGKKESFHVPALNQILTVRKGEGEAIDQGYQ